MKGLQVPVFFKNYILTCLKYMFVFWVQ